MSFWHFLMIHPIHLISLVNVICHIHHSQYCPVIHQSGQTKVVKPWPDDHLKLHTFNSIDPWDHPSGMFYQFCWMQHRFQKTFWRWGQKCRDSNLAFVCIQKRVRPNPTHTYWAQIRFFKPVSNETRQTTTSSLGIWMNISNMDIETKEQ